MTPEEIATILAATKKMRQDCTEAATALASVEEENESLRKDAERYRWLREHLPSGTMNDLDVNDAASWDAAVDAGLANDTQAKRGARL